MVLKYIILSCLCALAASDNSRLIFNMPSMDQISMENELPHEVLIKTGKPDLKCGGSIVSSSYILTLGKCCIGDPSGTIVNAGRLVHYMTTESFQQSVPALRFVYQYPDNREKGFCLIQVNPLRMANNVDVINLYDSDWQNLIQTTSGWAVSKAPTDPLRSVKVVSTIGQICNSTYNLNIELGNFCTQQANEGPVCLNNIGSGVVYNYKTAAGNKFFLTGLSQGYPLPCKENNAVSPIQAVFPARNWIESIIKIN